MVDNGGQKRARTKFNSQRSAIVLVEAEFFGDKGAASKFNVSTRSIRRWRERLETDNELAANVLKYREKFLKDWTEELPLAIKKAIRFLITVPDNADTTDSKIIRAITEALKTLTEVSLTKGMLDARFASKVRTDRKKT
jgi:hypothetical protein